LATVAIGSLAVLGAAPVAAGEPVTCNYDSTSHGVRVDLYGDNTSVELKRDVSGHITYGGIWCGGVATVTNTDTVLVIGVAEDQQVQINLSLGGFKPGFTNEAGKSDEIEFTINLGTGSQDKVVITGDDLVQNIVLGQGNTQFGIVRRMNLNAGEGTGVDSDVAMIGVEDTTVYGLGGNDKVRARGAYGTGPDAFGLPLYVYAGEGNDEVRGGSAGDHLFAIDGNDKVWGHEGPDYLYLEDGVQGNDFGRGGRGKDFCFKDPQDDCVN
jgi:hypothetical protein